MTEIDTEAAARRPVASLAAARPFDFTLRPGPDWRAALVAEFGLLGLRKLRFAGRLEKAGEDVTLTATLGATVVQPCVVTLAPVTTRIDVPVARRFLAAMPEPEGDEAEMPEDEDAEPLPAVIDLGAILAEALALALPLYPRADGAAFGDAAFAEDGVAPLTDDEMKPFAGLGALRDRREEDGD